MNAIFLQIEANHPLKKDGQEYEVLLAKLLEKHLAVTRVNSVPMGDGGFHSLYTGAGNGTVTVRLYPMGTVAIKIEKIEQVGEAHPPETYEAMLKEMAKVFDCHQHGSFSIVKQENEQRCTVKTKHRMATFNAEKILFDEESPFQQVQVLQTHLGKMLFLDGDLHLMANDSVYPIHLLQRRKEDLKGKEVLLIGGGIGVILHELLKEKPKFVAVVEIDEAVIRAGRTCVREENGGVLDTLKGSNYEVVVGNCIDYIRKLIQQGRKFDFVVSSVSESPIPVDQPITTSPLICSFLRNLINLSFKVLRPSGKYLCHATDAANLRLLEKFENELLMLDEPVNFTTSEGYIPTALSYWRFYQLWRMHP